LILVNILESDEKKTALLFLRLPSGNLLDAFLLADKKLSRCKNSLSGTLFAGKSRMGIMV